VQHFTGQALTGFVVLLVIERSLMELPLGNMLFITLVPSLCAFSLRCNAAALPVACLPSALLCNALLDFSLLD
jgi:hypothetical protein